MAEDRRIDARRKAAFQMEIGHEDDRSPIKDMYVLGGSMHVIKAKGIYRVRLADEIDPKRTNSSLPNTQQRVLAFGTDSELVRQTLLTAKRLFSSQLLGPSFEYSRAIDLSFEALKDVIAMHEMCLQLDEDLRQIEATLQELASKEEALTMPSVEDIQARVETFTQKADHAISDLFEIAKLFYPDQIGRKWFESLLSLSDVKYGPHSPFSTFLKDVLPVLKLVRNARNCVEHPSPQQRLEVFDITLLPSHELQPPALEIIHPETAQPLIAVANYMAQSVEQIAGIFELMLVFLCACNVQPFAGLAIQVVEYPANLQEAYGVRFGYGTYDGDRVIPFG